jgi:hypothetical protein
MATLCLAMNSAVTSLLIPGASGANTSPFTIFCLPPDSMVRSKPSVESATSTTNCRSLGRGFRL